MRKSFDKRKVKFISSKLIPYLPSLICVLMIPFISLVESVRSWPAVLSMKRSSDVTLEVIDTGYDGVEFTSGRVNKLFTLFISFDKADLRDVILPKESYPPPGSVHFYVHCTPLPPII